TNGPTGTMPQDFWDWLGSIVNTIVNGLLTAGQLIYGGLIAIANFFVVLGEAIVDWGMALVGTFQAALGAIQQAVEKVMDVLGALVNLFVSAVQAALQAILAPLEAWGSSVIAATEEVVAAALLFDASPETSQRLATAMGGLLLAVFDPAIVLVFGVMAFAIQAAVLASFATGIGGVIVSLIVPLIISTIVSVILEAVAPALEGIVNWISELVVQPGWAVAGIAIASVNLIVVLFSAFGKPDPIYRTFWGPPKSALDTGWDYEIVSEKKPNKSWMAILLASISLTLAWVASLAIQQAGASAVVSVIIDIFAVAAAAVATFYAVRGWDRFIFGKLTLALSGAALVHASASLIGDLNRAADEA
ncbi:MAG: hypothetical protein ACE5IQ_14510, partial [Candidatus Methylomirabilales bacterium]